MHRLFLDVLDRLVFFEVGSDFFLGFGAQPKHVARQNLFIAVLVRQQACPEDVLVPLPFNASDFLRVVGIFLDDNVHSLAMFPVVLHRAAVDVFLFDQLSRTTVLLIFRAFSHPTVYHLRWFLLEPLLYYVGKDSLLIIFAVLHQ